MVDRDALASKLHCVGVPELVGSEAASNSGLGGEHA